MSEERYPINDMYVAIQGEGVQTGVPMVLLRLHGCDVGCPWCDTKETWAFEVGDEQGGLAQALGTNGRFAYQTAAQIVAYMSQEMIGPKWVLVTGGEPGQYPLRPLVEALHAAGYLVALETSGTEVGHLGAGFDWVCISPKIDMPGGRAIMGDAFNEVNEIKHVVGKKSDIERLDQLLATYVVSDEVQICLQPISQSKKATVICMATVVERGWRLSVQVHKYLDIR